MLSRLAFAAVVLGSFKLAAQAAPSVAMNIKLPIRQIALYQNGVGLQMNPWNLSKTTPAVETIGTGDTGLLYRFEVQVDANSTKTFTMSEFHTHPFHHKLAEMSAGEIAAVMKDTHDNADVTAKLQPILDAKRKIADLRAQMKDQQHGIDEANAEEARLRQNIVALKGTAEEKPLAKRYTDAMLPREDKLSTL